MKNRVAIIGSGPAALMCCEVVANSGFDVHLFEKRSGFGRKLLIAGSSGLNIGNNLELHEFAQNITPTVLITAQLQKYFTDDWLTFIHDKLSLKTFLGSSGKYFVEEMHAANVLNNWMERLKKLHVTFFNDSELVNFEHNDKKQYLLEFKKNHRLQGPYDALGLFLGGGSWEEAKVEWPKWLTSKGFQLTCFTSENTGFHVLEWHEQFLKEAEGKVLKDCIIKSKKGSKQGDVVITQYGLEGTPIYFVGEIGSLSIDLIPNLTAEKIFEKLNSLSENLSPLRRVQKVLNLNAAALAMLYHLTNMDIKSDLKKLCTYLKNFPLNLTAPRPLTEAISSGGGVNFENFDQNLMSHQYPGLFMGGEMLNWSAPTGGFLIQTSVTQGFIAGHAMVEWLKNTR